jgi:hypothetical protein
VEVEPVRLDDHPLLDPGEVDLVAEHAEIRLWRGQTDAAHEREHQPLEVGVREHARDVDQRPGGSGEQELLASSHVEAIEPAAVHADAVTRTQLRTTDRHVDVAGRRRNEPPHRRGASVAQHRARPTGEQRRHLRRPTRRLRADAIDAPVQPRQPPGRQPAPDRPPVEADRQQLLGRDHDLLTCGERDHPPVHNVTLGDPAGRESDERGRMRHGSSLAPGRGPPRVTKRTASEREHARMITGSIPVVGSRGRIVAKLVQRGYEVGAVSAARGTPRA